MRVTAVDSVDVSQLSLGYSLRRYYVDQFLQAATSTLTGANRVLDIGGHPAPKRGHFNIESVAPSVVYANIIRERKPHVQADALHLPFQAAVFDTVLCTEVMEHLPDPRPAIAESRRVLCAGGELILTVPFLFPVHADPADYARYTPQFWREVLAENGFVDILIEQQGGYWSTLADAGRHYVDHLRRQERPRFLRNTVRAMMLWAMRRAVRWDAEAQNSDDSFAEKYASGYGIRATRG